MADDPDSTKPDPCARPCSPDHTHTESTSGTPRPTPTEPRWWPDDPYGLIFLPRFVEKIGRRVFADWAGTEVTLSEVGLLPELVEADNFERIIASSLLREHRPDLGQQDFISSSWSAGDNARRHELWRIAQQIAQQLADAPPWRRLRRIWAEIRRQSCAGELSLKIRRVSGGPFKAFQPVWWNRDNPNELFDRYIIDPKYPFGGRPSWKPNTDSWIFAPREGINQIVVRLMATLEAHPQLSRSATKVELDPAVQASTAAQNAPEQLEAKTVLPPSAPDAAPTPGPEGDPSAAPVSATSAESSGAGPEPKPSSPEPAAQEPQPPPAAPDGDVPVPPAGGSSPPASDAEVEPEGSPVAKSASVVSGESPGALNRGGRPTDRDIVVEEAAWRLKRPGRTQAKTLKAFGLELREWLKDHGEYRVAKTGEVMQAETIEDHVRSLWNSREKFV